MKDFFYLYIFLFVNFCCHERKKISQKRQFFVFPDILQLWFVQIYISHILLSLPGSIHQIMLLLIMWRLFLTSCYYRSCDTISDILLLSFVRYYLWHPVIIVRAILSLTSCYYCSCDTISDILLLLFAWMLFQTSCCYFLHGSYF